MRPSDLDEIILKYDSGIHFDSAIGKNSKTSFDDLLMDARKYFFKQGLDDNFSLEIQQYVFHHVKGLYRREFERDAYKKDLLAHDNNINSQKKMYKIISAVVSISATVLSYPLVQNPIYSALIGCVMWLAGLSASDKMIEETEQQKENIIGTQEYDSKKLNELKKLICTTPEVKYLSE
ncbi:MAG: hypothetical protein ACP5NV_06375 [Candidatus Woesearchaeota archaeon]